jgi:coenzyme F420-reducing hydrogenase alpha subunit
MADDTRTIKVDYLARVEGEGALYIEMKDGVATDVRLQIFEPPRFFEGFLQGRSFREAPDITARICGICPVAYQMSSCHAMEDALGVTLPPDLRQLRRLLARARLLGLSGRHRDGEGPQGLGRGSARDQEGRQCHRHHAGRP